jgi:hypothetical protein
MEGSGSSLLDAPFGQPHPLQDCLGEEQGKAPIELRPKVMAQHFLGSPRNRPFGRVLNSFSLGIKEKVVLPRRIELPTPSLPRTCSTTELRQRQEGRAGCRPPKTARTMPLWASQGKARKNPDFSVAFINFPQFGHRPIMPGR